MQETLMEWSKFYINGIYLSFLLLLGISLVETVYLKMYGQKENYEQLKEALVMIAAISILWLPVLIVILLVIILSFFADPEHSDFN